MWLASTPTVTSRLASALRRLDWLLAGRVGVQAHEDLAIRKSGRHLMSGMNGERGLADPGHAANRANADDATRLAGSSGQPHDRLQLRLAACEGSDVPGQGASRGRNRARAQHNLA